MEKVLEVVEIKKAFGGNKVLEGVSFSAEAGKVVGIIGPNGSGKTTLINILSGVLTQDHGKILFMGMDISHEKAYVRARLGIGRTFQIPRAFPSLTVWENLQLAQLHSGKEVSIESVLKRVGLYEFRDRYSDKLSLAQRKRLELARALMLKPKLLLLDEVFAGMNPASIREVSDVIKGLKEECICIIMVEHVLSALMPLADEIIVLADGRVIYRGDKYGAFKEEKVRRAYLGEKYSSFRV
jgi:ABC-type branched-chain amino acid transport systems, ATPase component